MAKSVETTSPCGSGWTKMRLCRSFSIFVCDASLPSSRCHDALAVGLPARDMHVALVGEEQRGNRRRSVA